MHDIGDGGVNIEARDPLGLPETLTVVTPQPCKLTFVPAGAGLLPDGLATVDTFLLSAYPDSINDYRTQLPGRPQPAFWALTGISPTSFEAQLKVWSDAASSEQLDAAWRDGSPATPEDGRENFRTQVMVGEFDVPLEAGVAIGDLDPQAAQLGLRIYDPGGELIHPGIVLPDFDEVNRDLVCHPLITELTDLDVDVQIFLQFRYLKVDNSPTATVKAAFKSLVGATVEAVNALPGNVMDSGVTDASGSVAFFVSNWDWALGGTADVFFRVTVAPADSILLQHGRLTRWDGTWTTRSAADPFEPAVFAGSVNALNGSPGYYEDYAGWTIGSAANPVVFNLGTPVLLRAEYQASGRAATVAPWRPVPRGTEIQLGIPRMDYPGVELVHVTDTFYADQDGEVWGTSFDVDYGNGLEILLPLAIAEDATANFVDSIELPRVVTLFNPLAWHGRERDPSHLHWASFVSPAIGDPANLVRIRVDHTPDDEVAATLFMLKCVRETHLWFRTITSSASGTVPPWQGIEGAWVHLNDTVVTDVLDYVFSVFGQHLPSNNAPSAGVLLHERNKWDRDTIIHEFSHGVMWQLTPIGLGDFLCAIVTGNYSNHSLWRELSEFSALIEGWSNLAANALGGGGMTAVPATPPANIYDSAGNTVQLGSVPLTGRRIEGCFTGAFWNWLRNDAGLKPCVDSDLKDLQMEKMNSTKSSRTRAESQVDAPREECVEHAELLDDRQSRLMSCLHRTGADPNGRRRGRDLADQHRRHRARDARREVVLRHPMPSVPGGLDLAGQVDRVAQCLGRGATRGDRGEIEDRQRDTGVGHLSLTDRVRRDGRCPAPTSNTDSRGARGRDVRAAFAAS